MRVVQVVQVAVRIIAKVVQPAQVVIQAQAIQVVQVPARQVIAHQVIVQVVLSRVSHVYVIQPA